MFLGFLVYRLVRFTAAFHVTGRTGRVLGDPRNYIDFMMGSRALAPNLPRFIISRKQKFHSSISVCVSYVRTRACIYVCVRVPISVLSSIHRMEVTNKYDEAVPLCSS